MTLRTFRGSDGAVWTMWRVRSAGPGAVPGTPLEWVAFQNADGTERRRLFDLPKQLEELADDRLDLLRRMAEPAPRLAPRHSDPVNGDAVAASLREPER